jgi:hypothetical protein
MLLLVVVIYVFVACTMLPCWFHLGFILVPFLFHACSIMVSFLFLPVPFCSLSVPLLFLSVLSLFYFRSFFVSRAWAPGPWAPPPPPHATPPPHPSSGAGPGVRALVGPGNINGTEMNPIVNPRAAANREPPIAG